MTYKINTLLLLEWEKRKEKIAQTHICSTVWDNIIPYNLAGYYVGRWALSSSKNNSIGEAEQIEGEEEEEEEALVVARP